MKNLVLFSTFLLSTFTIQAQPWLQHSNQPQKLEDIIKAYQNTTSVQAGEDEEEMENGDVRSEGKNYHFERWVWYWNQHLDENGYMVSPMKTVEEWNNYKATHNTLNKNTVTNESQWTFDGPSHSPGGGRGIGRIQVVDFHPTDINTFIVGTAGGGAWRTEDAGLTWTSLIDNLPILGVSDVDYNPLNPNTIYICTGDRDGNDNFSIGVYKSTDGGSTWNPTNLQYTMNAQKEVNSLLINPLDTNSLTLATGDGLYKSYDAGMSWQLKATGEYKDIKYCPGDTSIIYGAVNTGGSYNIFRSADGGSTWTQVTLLSGSSRIALAVTPQNPAIVKAIASNSNPNYGLLGIFSSSDTGKTFTMVYNPTSCNKNILANSPSPNNNSCDGQGWYDLCIAINPLDSNKLYAGGVNTYSSSNGGTSWQVVNQWQGGAPGAQVVHADKHFLIFQPNNPSTIFECNDGGIYKSINGTLWTDLTNGLGITQFYRNSVADAANFVIGGAQDNGSKKLDFSGSSTELTGGDGMDCQIDYDNPSTFYTSSQYGSFSRTVNGGTNFSGITNSLPQGNWTSPILIDPSTHTTIFVGLDHLYMSTNQGGSWTDLTPTLSSTLINRIAKTPLDPNMIFIQYGTTNMRYSTDMGTTWLAPSLGYSGAISDIKFDPFDKNRIWVTYSGYTTAKVTTYKIGSGWTAKNDSLPNIPIKCIVIDSSNGTKYIGTEIGVFYRDTTMTGWALYNNGLPTVQVTDLGINYATNEVWAATFGRGMWKSPRHIVVPNGISNIPYAIDVIAVAPNPNKGSFKILTSNQALIGQKVTVDLISFSGSKVLSVDGVFDASGKLSINANNIARGTYIVDVNKGNMIFARTKMIVL